MEATQPFAVSKKRKFVADGVMYSELNEYLARLLANSGYSGVVIRSTPGKTEVIVKVTKPNEVVGQNGRNIRELSSLISKRFNIPSESLDVCADEVLSRGLSAQIQAESLKYKLLAGLAVRRACSAVLRFVMEAGAKGAEVSVSGKVRGQRAKSQKFSDGYMIKTGFAREQYVTSAVRHVMMKQGILGVKVSIMLPHDPRGHRGPSTPLADVITVLEPKDA